MVNLSDNAKKVFLDLYCKENESIEDSFKRVASEFATNLDEQKLAFDLQLQNIWRPSTPCYFNAGKNKKIFSACWVVALEDSMDNIFDISNVIRKIFQFGAGVGIPIGNLREKDAPIFEGKKGSPPEGKSSGMVEFMSLYDKVGSVTKSGGRVRRAAILCSTPIWHPDILDFIKCKEVDGTFSNMNISVSITNRFMQALKDNTTYTLHTPYDGSRVGEAKASEVWNKLCKMAWKTGDPGVLFIDTVNKYNPLKKIMLIETTNPCGEQPLPPWSACHLSMINIAKFVKPVDGDPDNVYFDFNDLFNVSYNVMGLMDNLIDKMDYPDKRFKENTLRFRPVGIGPGGLSDAMFALDLKYNAKDGREFAAEVMRIMTHACIRKSIDLAKEKGKLVDYETIKEDIEEIIEYHITPDSKEDPMVEETLKLLKEYGVRNSQFTTCQPTGTTALSCDCSYGMEPSFGLIFEKNLSSGEKMKIVNSIFEEKFRNSSWYNEDLLEKIILNSGSLKNIRGIPKEVREIFVTAHDIKPKDRIDLQAALQRHCSTAISSTINLPHDTLDSEISEIFEYSFDRGLKGVTIYRDGCKKDQPVTFKKGKGGVVTSDFHRPTRLSGDNFKVELAGGNLYVSVSTLQGKPIEVFLQMGKPGQEIYGYCEAIGRLVSVSLQNGISLETIIKQLININSETPNWFRFEDSDKKPVQLLSAVDAVAKLLDRYYIKNNVIRELDGTAELTMELCPKCSNISLVMMEGCITCRSCGYSKCS